MNVLSLAQNRKRSVRGPIKRDLSVKRFLPIYVSTEAGHLLREGTIDECRGGRRARERRAGVRKPERRSAIPYILHCRVVMQSGAINKIGFGGAGAGVFADDP